MGRKPLVNPTELEKKLLTYGKTLFINGKLHYGSIAWTEISQQMNNIVKPYSLYLIVSQNRFNILSNLKKNIFPQETTYEDNEKINLKDESGTENSTTSNTSDTENSTTSNFDTDSENSNDRVLDLDIPYEKYFKMKPINIQYGEANKKRDYKVLKPGSWTDIIYEEMYKKFKLPCCIVFKRCKIYPTSVNMFLKIFGRCKDENCQINIYGFAKEKPLEDDPLKLKIYIPNSKNIEHTYNFKRPLRGEQRKIKGKELQNTEGYLMQKELVNKSMAFGEKIPPHVYSTEVLRKAKQNYRDKSLGIEMKDPIKSLIELKYLMPYAGSIHLISADPFIIHYWSPEQQLVFNEACKSKVNNCRLCIDATGQLVKKITRTSQGLKSSHIFLYAAVLHNGLFQTPVSQMLSEAQDMSTISYWLNQWIKSGAKLPHEIICDYSYALIGAITLSYCQMSRSRYCDMCLKVLQNKEKSLPPVFIRLDIAHLVKMICRWKCLGKGRIKEFFVRSLIILVESDTLEKFEDTFVKIVVIASSETDGLECLTSVPAPAESFRCHIINMIKDTNPLNDSHLYDEDLDIITDQDLNEENYSLDKNMDAYLAYLTDKIDNYCSVEGSRINAYYNPELKINLMRIVKDFPMWSNVMNNYFKSNFITATSAPVEGYIGKLKSKFSKPLTADRFVTSHLKTIESETKMSRSIQIENRDKVIKTNKHKLLISNTEDIGFKGINDKTKQIFSKTGISNNNGSKNILIEDNLAHYNISDDNNILKTICDDLNEANHILDNSEFETINTKHLVKDRQNDGGPDDDIFKDLFVDEYYSENDVSKDEQSEENMPEDYDEIENWKNLGEKPLKKLKRPTKYKGKCPEIEKRLNRSGLRSSNKCLIVNGNLCKPAIIDNKKYIIYNTCPFDSLLSSVVMTYIESNKYRELVDEKATKNQFLAICREVAHHKCNSIIYQKRAQILMEIFRTSKNLTDIYTVFSECNISNMTEKLLIENPSSIEKRICLHCNSTKTFENILIIISINYQQKILKEGIHHLPGAVCDYMNINKRICGQCDKKEFQITKELQVTIRIETDWIAENCALADIPMELVVNTKR